MKATTLARLPAVQRGVISILGALAILLFPQLTGALLYLLIGVGAVVVGLIQIGAWRLKRRASELVQALALVGVGTAVLVGGDRIDRYLELLVALLLALKGLHLLFVGYRAWRAEGNEDSFWPIAKGVLSISAAVLLAVTPETIMALVVVLLAVGWMVSGAVVIINAIGEDEDTEIPDDLVGVIRSKSMEPDERRAISEVIFDGLDTLEGTVRFVALMSFASAIATFGIKADSTAVVIGAMLIAPLMSPIMALSASILMGYPRRALLSGRRVAIGVAVAIGGSFLMSLISPEFVEIAANSQVLSRVAPTLLDLLIALAAGAAGGYAMTHPAVGNSLPGVAIAVALVPPLSVVGVALQETEFAFAAGAFLLFLTNLVGIVVATGVTYVLSGYSPWTRVADTDEQRRRPLVMVGVALTLVVVPLSIIGDRIVAEATVGSRTKAIVRDWLGPETEFIISSSRITGEEVEVTIVGPDNPPPPEDLAADLRDGLDRDISLQLSVVPEQRVRVEVTLGGNPVVLPSD